MGQNAGQGFSKVKKQLNTQGGLDHLQVLLNNQEWNKALIVLEDIGYSPETIASKKTVPYLKKLQQCYYFLEELELTTAVGFSILEILPQDLDVLTITASACRRTHKHQESIRLCKQTLEILPGNNELKYNYANCLRDAGNHSRALEIYDSAIKGSCEQNPVSIGCYENYISLLMQQRCYKEAEEYCIKALSIYPNHFKITYLHADTNRYLGKYNEVLDILNNIDTSTLSNQHSAFVCVLKAQALEVIGEEDRALELCKQALELDSTYTDARMQLLQIYTSSGRNELAQKELKKMVEVDQLNCEAHRRLTIITKYNTTHWHYKMLNQVYNENKNTLSNQDKKRLHFALAKAEEECGRIEEASFHLTKGNQLMNEEVSKFFNLEEWMNRAIYFLELDRKILNSKITKNRDVSLGKGLIFIVGMPRSGSTLTESILTMAPKSIDLGETSAFQRAVDHAVKKIDQTQQFSADDLDELCEVYYKQIGIKTGNYSVITDKNLYNWRYAGLIAHCLPSAKIIHSFRNPLDNMLSIYKALFPLGNEYSFDLESIYKVYQLQEQCMRYYKQRHPKQVIGSSYDELVSDPNTVIRSLISSLEMQWDDSFLTPENNRRRVRTASSAQVRESIHKKSVRGWKRYSDLLQPYADGFKKLGYKIE